MINTDVLGTTLSFSCCGCCEFGLEAAGEQASFPGSALSFSAMDLGGRTDRSHGGNCGLQFVVPAGYDIGIALHHRLEADPRNFGGVILFGLTDFCIHRAGTLENTVSLAPGMRQVTATPLKTFFRAAFGELIADPGGRGQVPLFEVIPLARVRENFQHLEFFGSLPRS
jgi:hypothetical protein